MKPKTVCAWCGAFLGGEPDGDDITHGTCESCAESFRTEAMEGLKLTGKTMPGLAPDSKWTLTEIAERN